MQNKRVLTALLIFIIISWSTIVSSIDNNYSYENITFIKDNGIRLYADELNIFNQGNMIEMYALRGESKPFIAWYNHSGSGVGWFGCHYNLSNGDVHQHCSIETIDSTTGYINTRFEIRYGDSKSDLYAKFTNIGDLILGHNVDLKFTGSESDIEGTKEIDIFPSNQKIIGLRITNNSDGVIIYGLGTNKIELIDNLIISSPNPLISLNSSSKYNTIKINRVNSTSFSSFVLSRGNVDRWSIQLRDDGTDDLHVRNNIFGKSAIRINQSPRAEVYINNLSSINGGYVCASPEGRLYVSENCP